MKKLSLSRSEFPKYLLRDGFFRFSSGTISGTSSVYTLQDAYGWAFGTYSSEPSSQWGIDADPSPQGSGVDYSGTSTFGLITNSNFPAVDLNQENLNSTGSCGPAESGPEGYTATGIMYLTSNTINISSWVDDGQDIFFKPITASSWNSVSYGCCHLSTQNVGVTPGLYDVMVQWFNSCGGGVSSMFITNAFMEYSRQWSITPWDGGSFSTTLVNGVPSGDIADSSPTSTFTGGWP